MLLLTHVIVIRVCLFYIAIDLFMLSNLYYTCFLIPSGQDFLCLLILQVGIFRACLFLHPDGSNLLLCTHWPNGNNLITYISV